MIIGIVGATPPEADDRARFAQQAATSIPGVRDAAIDTTFSPDAARLQFSLKVYLDRRLYDHIEEDADALLRRKTADGEQEDFPVRAEQLPPEPDVPPLRAEQLREFLESGQGIFDGVMEQSGDDRRLVQLELGQKAGNLEGMDEVRLSRIAKLTLVYFCGVHVRLLDEI